MGGRRVPSEVSELPCSLLVLEFNQDVDWSFLLFESTSGELVGGCGLHRRSADYLEIGYWVRSDRHRRGYATAAAQCLTDAGFACVDGWRASRSDWTGPNAASADVPAKLGYERAGEGAHEKRCRPAVAPVDDPRAVASGSVRKMTDSNAVRSDASENHGDDDQLSRPSTPAVCAARAVAASVTHERLDGVMSTDPWRPTTVETLIYEPDEQAVIAVVPAALWLQPGDLVELDDPPREARVLSSRLQLRPHEPARVLIVLDVPDAVLQGDAASDTMLGADVDETPPTDTNLDAELERLTDEVGTDQARGDA
jgi:hypothetical protein